MKGRAAGALLCVVLAGSCTGGGPSSSVAPNPGSGGTLRVGMTGGPLFAMDPQYEWSFDSWELFRCCLLRTLMSYDGTAGVGGTEPKPDLAVAPPEVSTDGRTWTFHLRPGLRYAPPLQDVPITSSDIVRALLRSGDPHTSSPFGLNSYLSDIEGFTNYLHGKADSISGVETPDPTTLVIHQIRPDTTLPYVFALAMTAPIPPSPNDPTAPYGVATGHDRSADPSKVDGYGLFLVSSGPYMIEGADGLDLTLPPDRQSVPSGFRPWGFDSDFNPTGFGSLTLVRNPSWSASDDPLRAALADRIEVHGGAPDALFRQVDEGRLDIVFDGTPPAAMLHRYLDDPALRPLVQSIDTANLVMADFILTEPPFDDLAVRLAVADALDRAAMLPYMRRGYNFGGAVLASHYASDASEAGLATGWDPFPGANGAPDIAAARRQMARSRYASGGRCTDPVCRDVTVYINPTIGPVAKSVVRSLAALGIEAHARVSDRFYDLCKDPPAGERVVMCIGDGWFPDFPSVGNLIVTNFGGPTVTSAFDITGMGATASQLAALGSPVRSVPSIAREIVACNTIPGPRGIACWTGLDQYLVTKVMPSVPLGFGRMVRIAAPSITGFSWDLGYQSPALDRLGVSGG